MQNLDFIRLLKEKDDIIKKKDQLLEEKDALLKKDTEQTADLPHIRRSPNATQNLHHFFEFSKPKIVNEKCRTGDAWCRSSSLLKEPAQYGQQILIDNKCNSDGSENNTVYQKSSTDKKAAGWQTVISNLKSSTEHTVDQKDSKVVCTNEEIESLRSEVKPLGYQIEQANKEIEDLKNLLKDQTEEIRAVREESWRAREQNEKTKATQQHFFDLKTQSDRDLEASRKTIDELQAYIRRLLEKILSDCKLHWVLSVDKSVDRRNSSSDAVCSDISSASACKNHEESSATKISSEVWHEAEKAQRETARKNKKTIKRRSQRQRAKARQKEEK
ncbi:hypothetical protein BY458DRAFT_590200 [Sporodiniella umbellata]|nr:hypothetical protein BY458DRAFT_590200 [Sporodiniella umbellata]